MHINHRYLLWKASQLAPGAAVLDYGCGGAETVEHGRRMGLNIFGADVFYAGSDRREVVAAKGLLGNAVRLIENGRAPFPDEHFDLIVSNYVLEHVEDLDALLADVHRLLKPGGAYLTLFPTYDVWREGHCGLPFVHWLPKGSRLKYWYTLSLRRLGMGLNKAGKSAAEWAEDFVDYMDRYTVYRRRETVYASFSRARFDLTLIENDYIQFRLAAGPLYRLAPITQLPLVKSLGPWLFRKLAGLHIWAEKARSHK